MTPFDRIIVVDWSARSAPSPARPSPDAIWVAEATPTGETVIRYHRTRAAAMAALTDTLAAAQAAGQRVLAGFDFPFGYPQGFARAVTGRDDPLGLWEALAERITDTPDNANNRFEVAAALNALFPGAGPFWGCPAQPVRCGLPTHGTARHGHGMAERRAVEAMVPRAQPCWKLYTTGSVGSQALLGLPHLAALRQRFAGSVAVWPFEPMGAAPIVLAEVYPSLLADAVAAEMAAQGPAAEAPIKDAAQVRVLARSLMAAQAAGTLEGLFGAPPDGPALSGEGWILGVGAEAALRDAAAAPPVPPRLSNDCFALPQGVDWTPVDVALDLLRDRLTCTMAVERCAVAQAAGRVLAADVTALRSNPPGANAAVDGYGFAAATLPPRSQAGHHVIPLAPGRAAAGGPFNGAVPPGQALRILTGALIPAGVDTVLLQEDVTATPDRIAFAGPVKPGSNTRKAGEDVVAGALALARGRVLTPADLALLSALGVGAVEVHRRLRVGVLSTGDELAEAGTQAGPDRTYDANRPMLLAIAARWGYAPVDLGHVGDDRAALRARLDGAAAAADVIVTSGGASAGDEDHVSALLRSEGTLHSWRIALKPGRPLALGMWGGVPILGLPGNPVAAFVCTLLFARPAFARLAGAGWAAAVGFTVPAGFSKRKKPGRREYLRARLTDDGAAEVFASEGSGRISGLSWADGLVELDDGAAQIAPGDPVRYLPFSGFGL